MKGKTDLLQGTLDMLVLRALQLEPMHGWGITERIEQWSESLLHLGQGTLYPALYRLERQGFIRSEWRVTANNRRARYYSLTAKGRRQLTEEIVNWEQCAAGTRRPSGPTEIAPAGRGGQDRPVTGRGDWDLRGHIRER